MEGFIQKRKKMLFEDILVLSWQNAFWRYNNQTNVRYCTKEYPIANADIQRYSLKNCFFFFLRIIEKLLITNGNST